jgi:hypothetical protein
VLNAPRLQDRAGRAVAAAGDPFARSARSVNSGESGPPIPVGAVATIPSIS